MITLTSMLWLLMRRGVVRCFFTDELSRLPGEGKTYNECKEKSGDSCSII